MLTTVCLIIYIILAEYSWLKRLSHYHMRPHSYLQGRNKSPPICLLRKIRRNLSRRSSLFDTKVRRHCRRQLFMKHQEGNHLLRQSCAPEKRKRDHDAPAIHSQGRPSCFAFRCHYRGSEVIYFAYHAQYLVVLAEDGSFLY